MRAVLVVFTAVGLVALPFVSDRGSRADLFGVTAFALLLSVARYFSERAHARRAASWDGGLTR